MIATLTPNDKKTLITMFAILTLATIVDIFQEHSNNINADQDRHLILNMTADLKEKLIKDNQVMERVDRDVNRTINNLTEHIFNVTGHSKLLEEHVKNETTTTK